MVDTSYAGAKKEFDALIRSNKRAVRLYGVAHQIDPVAAARSRRFDAEMVMDIARSWRAKGYPDRALVAYQVARRHFRIARMFDRMADTK